MIPSTNRIAATFNTETAKRDQKFQLIKQDYLPIRKLALFNSVSPPNLKINPTSFSTHSFYLSILALVN
jgi:hypothetical protein